MTPLCNNVPYIVWAKCNTFLELRYCSFTLHCRSNGQSYTKHLLSETFETFVEKFNEPEIKVGCVFLMGTWSEFRWGSIETNPTIVKDDKRSRVGKLNEHERNFIDYHLNTVVNEFNISVLFLI